MQDRILFSLGIWHLSVTSTSRLTFKKLEPFLNAWGNIVWDNYSNFDPFQFINMQAGVSNQVVCVLGIYERKRAGLLLEIDEKPELPNT